MMLRTFVLLSFVLPAAAWAAQESLPDSRPSDARRLSTFDTGTQSGAQSPGSNPAPDRHKPASPQLSKPTDVEVGVAQREGVKIRCYPSESGLLFDKTLRKDEKVLVRGIDYSGRYHDVEVLTGLPGFVAAKFVQVTEPGKGKTTGANVSLRVRPKAGEPPAATLTQGIELRLLHKEGDWWRVLAPAEIQAFVEVADLTLAGKPAGHDKDIAALREEGEKSWNDAVAAEKTRLAAEEKGRALALKIQDAAARFEQEKQRPIADADYQSVMTALQGVLDDAAREGVADSPAVVSGRALLDEVRRRRVLQEAHAAAVSVPPKANIAITPPAMKISERDPLSRFDGIGHLVYRPTPEGVSEYHLVKGGQLLFYVTCSSGKYDLQTFNNRELGLRGNASRPEGARVRVLDVSHIEVLGNK